MLASGINGKYTPGPGFYNQAKAKGAFNQEYVNPADGTDSTSPSRDDANGMFYFVIQNGTLVRKTQQFSSNKGIMRMPELPRERVAVPGPGKYSPTNANLYGNHDNDTVEKNHLNIRDNIEGAFTAQMAMKYHSSRKMVNSSPVQYNYGTVKVEAKPAFGKNPPKKVPLKCPERKTVPSIPARTAVAYQDDD